jgi:hypothetical protein
MAQKIEVDRSVYVLNLFCVNSTCSVASQTATTSL